MYKDINDYELLYLIAEKDEEAYNSIYNKYEYIVKMLANKIYRSSKYIGVSYDDIYQAGLYGLNMAITNFDEKAGTLFYTCANTFITREMIVFIRSHSRCKHNILSDSISLNAEIDEDGNAILDFIQNKNNSIDDYCENDYINTIINFKYDLPFVQSLVYELRINNFTNSEIATLLNIKYKTVDNAIRSIKGKLRKRLNKIEQLS